MLEKYRKLQNYINSKIKATLALMRMDEMSYSKERKEKDNVLRSKEEVLGELIKLSEKIVQVVDRNKSAAYNCCTDLGYGKGMCIFLMVDDVDKIRHSRIHDIRECASNDSGENEL